MPKPHRAQPFFIFSCSKEHKICASINMTKSAVPNVKCRLLKLHFYAFMSVFLNYCYLFHFSFLWQWLCNIKGRKQEKIKTINI